jgi:hypothetical protein
MMTAEFRKSYILDVASLHLAFIITLSNYHIIFASCRQMTIYKPVGGSWKKN